MNIVDKIIELANILDANNKFAEADQLTKIASEVANQRIANPVNITKMVSDQNRNNNTQMRIKNTLEETSTLKKNRGECCFRDFWFVLLCLSMHGKAMH